MCSVVLSHLSLIRFVDRLCNHPSNGPRLKSFTYCQNYSSSTYIACPWHLTSSDFLACEQALRKACSQATDFHIFLYRDFVESLNL